jgi:hypothetical protein
MIAERTVMSHMVSELGRAQSMSSLENKSITQHDYDQWRAGWIFDGIRGRRYGEAWCDHFSINDYLIRYSTTVESAHRMIQSRYVR